MQIRPTQPQELDAVMAIYARARAFMAEQGNPHQWGDTLWPPQDLIKDDIAAGKSYVFEADDGSIAAVFFYDAGQRVDPCYDHIDGAWQGSEDYGVVHRIASAGTVKGAGRTCIQWAIDRCGHLRMDTHEDNAPMRGLLESLGFIYCGTIYVHEDNAPRRAYEFIGTTR